MDIGEVKKLAAKANGDAWNYLQKETLGEDEKVQMLCCAYSSLYLWAAAGGSNINFGRAHWLISRICCVLGETNLAERHSLLCEAYTKEANDRKDFDEVYAIEARARVCALKGEIKMAILLKTQASEMASKIKNPEDKNIAEGDLRSQPWFGLN